MSCNCKNDKYSLENNSNGSTEKTKSFGNYFLKTLVFLIFLLFLPIVMIAFVVIGFKVFVLGKNINIKPILLKLAETLSTKKEDDDDDYEISEDDLIMVGVEDITNKKY
jgi:hypothetical protein